MKKVSILFLLSSFLNPSSIFIDATATCVPGVWSGVDGLAMKYVTTSADTNHIWGIDPTGQVYYKGGKGDTWTHIETPTAFKQITVNGDGSHVWGITWEENDVYRNGRNGAWQYAIDNAKNWIHLSLAADGNELIGLDEAYNVWQRFGYEGYWIRRTGSLKVASLTGDGEYGWGVDKDDGVWYRPGRLEKWTQLAGELSYISVSADGNHVWGCNCRGTVYYRAGKHDNWKSVDAGGSATQMSVSGDGSHVYKVDVRNDVSWIGGYPGKVVEDKSARRDIKDTVRRRLGASRRLAGEMTAPTLTDEEKAAAAAAAAATEAAEANALGLKEVSVSGTGDDVYGVDMNDRAWHKKGVNFGWEQVDLGVVAGVKSLSVGQEGYLWAVGSDGKPAVREGTNAAFEVRHGSGMRNIEASADGTQVYVLHDSGVIFYRDAAPGNWWIVDSEVSHRAKYISISAGGTHIWSVKNNGEVYYRTSFSEPMTLFSSLAMKQVAVSGDGHHVWGVTEEKKVYYRRGPRDNWVAAGGPDMDYISVNGDGSMIYGVNSDEAKTYRRSC